MPTVTESSPLSASALEAFLHHAEQALEQQIQSDLAPALIQDSLRSVLARQQYRADTPDSVRRLATLWSRAGVPDAALQVLDGDGAAVLADLPSDEYDDARLRLALTRVEVLGDFPAHGLASAADAACTLLRSLTHGAQSAQAWEYLGSLASSAGLFELERRCAQGHHAYLRAQPERSPYRAIDKAHEARWCGHSYAREGLAEQARSAAADAVKAFQQAGPDQELDASDWLHLGETLVTLMPESAATVIEHVAALTPPEAGPAQRRDIAVRSARLQARALYQQAELAHALETARAGRYALTSDSDDAFSRLVLDWLLEAGLHDAAAALAFESAFNEREGSADHASGIALAQLAGNSAGSGYWPLTLAWASTVEATQWVRGQADPVGFFQRHMALARAAGAPLPAIDAVQGLYLIDAAQDYATALPLLESAARDPALATSAVVPKLWLCRMRLHGVARALELPFVDVACAEWCYNIGVTLQYGTREQLAPGSAWPEQAVDALAACYYERGAAQFERFFATGQGMYRDADIHTYSMLCNNLAIHYRIQKSDYVAALELHQKGIEASSFAEHYDGVMQCLHALGDEARFIDAADQLWHYAADYGYSRHHPAHYIDDVAHCLHRQGRSGEIPIWLERLDEWWESLDESEQAEAGQYWETLAVTLYFMEDSHSADALARLEPALPALCAARRPRATRMAANTLRDAGQHERALALYEQTLGQIDPATEWHAAQRTYTLNDLEDCRRRIRASRPWWQFWK